MLYKYIPAVMTAKSPIIPPIALYAEYAWPPSDLNSYINHIINDVHMMNNTTYNRCSTFL